MSVVTGRRLQRFWQKGIKPLKDLLGNHDIADLSEDGTVTGALSKLNTDMGNIFGGREAEIRFIYNVQSDNTGYKEVTLGFNKKFSSVPYVFATLVAQTKATAQVIVSNVTTTSCTFRVYSEASLSNAMIQVMAIGAVA